MTPGSPRLQEVSVELEVPFRHVDMLGVVWHGHYFDYLEAARTELLGRCGLDVGDLIGPRFGLFVIESKCRHARPLHYRDRLRVTAWVRDFKRRINIQYEITELAQGRRVARAHTILAITDLERNLLLETPDEIQKRLLG